MPSGLRFSAPGGTSAPAPPLTADPEPRRRGRKPKEPDATAPEAAKHAGRLGSLFGSGRVEARPLTEREAGEMEESLGAFLDTSAAVLDGGIAALKGLDDCDIWELSDAEREKLVAWWIRMGRKKGKMARRARSAQEIQENVLEPGAIIFPRIVATALELGVPVQKRERRRRG